MAAEIASFGSNTGAHHRAEPADVPIALGAEEVLVGTLDGAGIRLGIVASRFNPEVTSRLFDGARRAAVLRGVAERDLIVVSVPGAFEIPIAAKALANSGRVDAIVCVGAVVRGETTHYELVSEAAARGLAEVQLETGIPIGFGVLSTENLDQAFARAGGAQGHKGEEAVDVAIEMVRLYRALRSSSELASRKRAR